MGVLVWTSCQIRKIVGCACAGNAGITYPRWRGKRSRHSRRMRTRNFTYLARGRWYQIYQNIHRPSALRTASKSEDFSLTLPWHLIVLVHSQVRVSGHYVIGGERDLVWHDWLTWWRHQMETFSALLAICAGNSPVPGEFPPQRPVTRSFDVFFDLRPNKRLSKQWWGWWFETPSSPLWRHFNEFGGCGHQFQC